MLRGHVAKKMLHGQKVHVAKKMLRGFEKPRSKKNATWKNGCVAFCIYLFLLMLFVPCSATTLA